MESVKKIVKRHIPAVVHDAHDLINILVSMSHDHPDDNGYTAMEMDTDDQDADEKALQKAYRQAYYGEFIYHQGEQSRIWSNNFDNSGTFLDLGSHSNATLNYGMPKRAYYRDRYGRRRAFRRRRRGRGRRAYMYSTKKIQKVIDKNLELKALDFTFDSATLSESALCYDNSGVVMNLSGIAQGNDTDERIGKQVQHVSLTLKGRFHETAAGVEGGSFSKANSHQMRLILVYQKHCKGTTPDITELLDRNIASSAANIVAMKNIEKGKNFYILWDKTWHIGGASFPEQLTFQKTIKVKRVSTFQGTAGATANCWMNHIWAFIWTDAADIDAAGVMGTLTTRLRYRDA